MEGGATRRQKLKLVSGGCDVFSDRSNGGRIVLFIL